MTCKDNCARCCCCGSQELREMPAYFEDVYDESRPVKARMTWDFASGFFNGLEFYLERVSYLKKPFDGSSVNDAHTDRVCLLEYRSNSSYDYGYPYEGYNCLSGPLSDAAVVTPWQIVRDSVCSGFFGETPVCNKVREFARIRAVPCDLVLNVMRCRKTNESCTYDPPTGQIDTCGYLITARMKFVFVVEVAKYEKAPPFSFDFYDACDDIVLPTVDEVYTFNAGAVPAKWSTTYSAVQEFNVTRSRVYYSLKNQLGTEDIFFGLSADKNMPECCTYWEVPMSNTLIDNAAGPDWMNDYFECTADPDVDDVEFELPCPANNDPHNCLGLVYNSVSCVAYLATFPIDLGLWEFYPT